MSRRLCAAALVLLPSMLMGQSVIRPAQSWETVQTDHFTVDFPTSSRDWSLDIARHLEAMRVAVDAEVGGGPTHRVTILIDDPYSDANGFAVPLLDEPTIVLFAAPPEPGDDIGLFRDWGTLLVTHEYTHIAHLTRPSRNTLERLVARYGPANVSPLAARAPRWVMEGYATFVEGRLTGSGRPNGTARAATLRQFALEGRLPVYYELNGSGRFEGGAMAYLAGSAFLEWLVAHHGDSTLPHLWRRMSARQPRTFDEAFTGVFGASPERLYGQFTAELTVKSFALANALAAAGVDTGATVGAYTWYTGAPAISADGRLLAIPVRSRGRATRIVLSSTAPWHGADSAAQVARRRLLARDPEDVPAIRFGPPPRRIIAELASSHNRGYDAPRFVRSDTADPVLLLARMEPRPDGALRPDLFLWRPRTGSINRVTHGAGVHDADPIPGQQAAVATRCHDGFCDLVQVSLSDGTVRVLREGSLAHTYDHPHAARDGPGIVVAVHDSARWTVQLIGNDSDRVLGPRDDANRYAPAFTPNGRSVVAVSDAGGIEHLEVIDLATNAVRIPTATTGIVLAPEPTDSAIYFLTTHATGRALQRVALSPTATLPSLPDTLAPAVIPAPPANVESMSAGELPSPHGYGIGPHGYRVLPGGAFAVQDRFATLALASADPVGRLSWTLQGALGNRDTWRGAAATAVWRMWPVELDAQLFAVWNAGLDYHGAMLAATLPVASSWHTDRYRFGISAGNGRDLAFAEAATGIDATTGDIIAGGALSLGASAGRTDGASWQRAIGHASAHLGTREVEVRGALAVGETNANAPGFERFVGGGVEPPLTDGALLTQRLVSPALPVGIATGRYAMHYRATLEGVAPVSLYFEGLAAGTGFGTWHRLYGAESRWTFPAIGFVRLPAIDAIAGAGYSIDAPFKYKLRGYLMLRYQP